MTAVRSVRPLATPRHTAARAAAWTSAAVTVGTLVLSAVLYARTGLPQVADTPPLLQLHPLIAALVGALVIDRRGNHVVGWLFAMSGLTWAIWHVGMAAGHALAVGEGFAGAYVLAWATTWSSFAGFGLAPALVLYVFPTGRLSSPAWRWPAGVAVAVVVLGAAGYAFGQGPLEDLPRLDNAYALEGALGTAATFIRELGWPALLLAIAGGVASLHRRYRSAPFDQRQQMKWLLLAGVVLCGFVCFWGVAETLGHPEVAAAVAGLFLPLFPLALGIAILRHRLYDIDVLINRTLVYVSLSAVLAAVYLGAVFLLSRVLSPFTNESNLAIAVSTLAVAALFRPLRAQIQRFIDRRFYRQKYDAVATLGRFSARLRDELDLDALEGEFLAVVGETLRPSAAGLWIAEKRE